jgi:hypothetical protein
MAVTEGQGALTGLTLEDEENEDKPKLVKYGVFQNVAQKPTMDLSNLQNVYGTAAMPVFQWVRTIQTGTREYDPTDTRQQELLEEYRRISEEKGVPEGFMSADEIAKATAIGTASQVAQATARQAGAALFDPYVTGDTTEKLVTGAKATFSDLPSQLVEDTTSAGFDLLAADNIKTGEAFYPELANRTTAQATGNLELYNKLQGTDGAFRAAQGGNVYSQEAVNAAKQGVNSNLTAEAITMSSQTPTYFSKVGERLYGSPQAAANWSSAAAAGVVNFGVQLLSGKDPVKAAKSAGASTIGTAIGNALLPGIGGIVGGVLGGIVGGRVICNELQKQGLMTKEDVLLDYRFTRDYLTPQHVRGYQIWAVHVVKRMRKGKGVKFWRHVAQHRSNEIAYIYGKRDKPDYLGKVYRRILEPTCWVVGAFAKTTDWSILYKHKEI